MKRRMKQGTEATNRFRFHSGRAQLLLVVLSLSAAALLSAGCRRSDSSASESSGQGQASFTALFRSHCAGCHGEDGSTGPAPPLDDAMFLAWMPKAEFRRTVREGRPGGLMPAFSEGQGGPLSEREIEVVVQGVYENWSDSSVTKQDLPANKPPAATQPYEARAASGRRLFVRICATCHGADGEGDMAGPLHDAAFLAVISDQTLRRIVVTGRPDLGMPNYLQLSELGGLRRALTSREIEDIVTFVTTWRSPAVTTQPSEPRRPS